MDKPKSKFEESLENGHHSRLADLIGEWEGVSKVWFEKDKLGDESPVKGTITGVLGGRFVLHQYQSSLGGKDLEGMAIIGFSFPENKFQTAWIDSFHMGTGIMFSDGDATAKGHSVLGSYGGVDMPERWGWRTEIMLNDDELIITAYNIPPGGEEEKATEISYRRVSKHH